MGELKAVEALDISFSYSGQIALRDVCLAVSQGEAVAIMGPNGAGKTTLLKVLAGALRPDRGSVWLRGIDLYHARLAAQMRCGYVSDSPYFYSALSGLENIYFYRAVYHGQLADYLELAQRLGLTSDNLRQPVASYSLGTRHKLSWVCSLGHNPDVVFLDEPFSPLDSPSRAIAMEICGTRIADGAALLLVSHLDTEIEKVADRVYQLKGGMLFG